MNILITTGDSRLLEPCFRLRFNNVDKLKVGIFNTEKEEEIFSLENVDDLFSYADSLKNTLKSYD